MTAAAPPVTAARQLGAEALAVMEKFPPRPVPASWDATAADRFTVMRRMLASSFLSGEAGRRDFRKRAMLKILSWLELHPGITWQERWDSSGAGTDGRADWRDQAQADLGSAGIALDEMARSTLGGGLIQLIGGDVLRPGLPWLLAAGSPRQLWREMGRTRDPAGITALRELAKARGLAAHAAGSATERVAMIMAAKGGTVADVTPGDCMQLLECAMRVYGDGTSMHSPFFYEFLHAAGAFPPGAPATVRMIDARFAGQLHPRPAHRPLRSGLPARPRPARGLPARTSARHRLQHPQRPGRDAGPVVLERPGRPPPGHQLAEAPP